MCGYEQSGLTQRPAKIIEIHEHFSLDIFINQ